MSWLRTTVEGLGLLAVGAAVCFGIYAMYMGLDAIMHNGVCY